MKVFIKGSIENIIFGRVSQESSRPLFLNKCAFGLGASVVESNGSLSVLESLVDHHLAHNFTSGKMLREHEVVYTPFYMGFEKKPSQKHQLSVPMTLHELIDDQLENYPDGFVFYGHVRCSYLPILYLKKSTIHQESIFNHLNSYVQKEDLRDQWTQIVGVASPDYDERLFYEHPYETESTPFFSHFHAVAGGKVAHILLHSVFDQGDFWVEPIEDVLGI